jgi:SAM-dependent methyltransferase
MTQRDRHDDWSAGDSYERYMGRWSRRLAVPFVERLGLPANLDWADVGCGTGALSSAVLARCAPRSLVAVDPSPGFIEHAQASIDAPQARFGFCTTEGLRGEMGAAGFADVEIDTIEIDTPFANFDDLWHPFTLGVGPAPGYVASLDDRARAALRARLQADVRGQYGDGVIALTARALMVRSGR